MVWSGSISALFNRIDNERTTSAIVRLVAASRLTSQLTTAGSPASSPSEGQSAHQAMEVFRLGNQRRSIAPTFEVRYAWLRGPARRRRPEFSDHALTVSRDTATTCTSFCHRNNAVVLENVSAGARE